MSDVQSVLRRAFDARSLCGLHIDLQQEYYRPNLRSVFDAVSRTAQSLRKFNVPNIWVACAMLKQKYPPRTFEEYQKIEKDILCEAADDDVVLLKNFDDLFWSLDLSFKQAEMITEIYKKDSQGLPISKKEREMDPVPDDPQEALLLGNPFHYLTRERKFDTFIMDGINAYACFMHSLIGLYRNAKKYETPVDVIIVPEGINISDWYDQTWVMEKKPELIDGDLTKTYLSYLKQFRNFDVPVAPHVLSVNEIDEILSPVA